MQFEGLIGRIGEETSVIAALDAGRRLRRQARREADPRAIARILLQHCGEDADGLTQSLLIRALAEVAGPTADRALTAMIGDGETAVCRHAAWALTRRPPVADAVPGLLHLAARGGFDTMLAQLALERWAELIPREISSQAVRMLSRTEDPGERSRLTETLSLVKGGEAQGVLWRLLSDRQESGGVRAAAARGLDPRFVQADAETLIAALDSPEPALRQAAVGALGVLTENRDARAREGLTAAAAAGDRRLAAAASQALAGTATGVPRRGGLRVAQIVLQGRVDAGLESAGSGDSGGLATLLVHLGRALGKRPEIERVDTVARAFGGAGVPDVYGRLEEPMGPGATLVRVPFGPERDLAVAEMWRHRLQIERGLERLFRRRGRLDALHLRFADAGTLAAARVARRHGIPVFFTLAPDPHARIRAAENAGTLCRRSFARADRREHLLFRAELVERMARDARRLALFPRPALERDLRELVAVDVAADRRRFCTVPEGIDTRLPERARREVSAPGPRPPVLEELARRVDALGGARRGLPLLIGLGRLHPVKGFHRLVEAWAGDPRLRRGLNLLLVGGDLKRPSATEVGVLQEIEAVLERFPEARPGLLLFGRRSNVDAARLLAAGRQGLAPGVAGGGVFACASDKEEFGLAILEAMAAGLAVVAPDSGGPATYVTDGDNGFLARTTSVPALRAGIHRALAAATDARRTVAARRLVRERFTVDAMAGALVRMYEPQPELQEMESAA